MDRFIKAPENPNDWPQWRQDLKDWRRSYRQLNAYAASYPDWVQGQYVQALVMLWDEELWNEQDGWRVNQLLDRADAVYGGWDNVVLWNNYPLSGVDRRDQFDYFNDLPGGLDGLKSAVADFHKRGVRVMIDHKPWVPGVPDGFISANRALAYVVEYCDLDGVYLDCGSHPKPDLKQYIEAIGPDKVFAAEATTPLEHTRYQPMSWAQFVNDSEAPGIMTNHWLERTFTLYETRRYYYHPMAELQRAWLSGGGHVIWENVFGYWAAYSPRYASWLRLCTAAQRYFVDAFIGEDWEPLDASQPQEKIYGSTFSQDKYSLICLCNRSGNNYNGLLVEADIPAGHKVYDVVTGQSLGIDGNKISGKIGEEGVAGILICDPAFDTAELQTFLSSQQEKHGAADFSFEPWQGEHRNTELAHNVVNVPDSINYDKQPANMLPVPGYSGSHRQRYRMRECGFVAGSKTELHIYDAFENECLDENDVTVNDLWVDIFPVTNQDFKNFIDATNYQPANTQHFLRHWHNGKIPLGMEEHPVVYVSLNDARAYATWAGKRLPTDAEWQRACLGDRPYQFPWGNEIALQLGHEKKRLCNDGRRGGTTPVTHYTDGVSPYGCMDMIGNTWEWTESERTDGHTRYALLKGGCWYGAEGSFWLFDGGPRGGDWAAKLILMHDGWDRCATIGFRCVADRTDGKEVHDRAVEAGDATALLGNAN